ncbi:MULTISPECIES: portal protein [unclassified Tatumella]|uniref:portal protein n=1 Tax=unclassified Tatumella TaxID=2649542 RepID=UPI0032C40CF0
MQSIQTRLAQAFLLNQSATRDAERVTAEEVQFMAQQLESVLAGVYISLSADLQMPIVRVLLNQLQATNKIPQLPPEALNPSISTGSEALGRGQDLNNLQQFIQAIGMADQLQQDSDINISTLKLRLGNAMGIDTSGLLLTPEEKAQAQAQQAQQQLLKQATESAGQGLGQMATKDPETLSSAMSNLGISPEALQQQGLNQSPQS